MIVLIWFVQMRGFNSTVPEVSSGTFDSFGEAKLSSEGLLLLKSYHLIYTYIAGIRLSN